MAATIVRVGVSLSSSGFNRQKDGRGNALSSSSLGNVRVTGLRLSAPNERGFGIESAFLPSSSIPSHVRTASLFDMLNTEDKTRSVQNDPEALQSAEFEEETPISATDSRCFQLKYRPRRFDDLVGHEFVGKILKAHLKQNSIKPAYLFSGPKGSGKTSAARIFAAAINCTKPNLGKSCGRCRQCKASYRGTNTDIREIDAASNSGVESIRSLLETVRYAPVNAKYKVYIIDECHMLSKEAANALLKTLEEPPPHVVFILVTTDPQKLLEPVISRCNQQKFRRIPDSETISVTRKIAQKEKIEVDDEALKLIAQLADGSLRDATKMLETVSCLDTKITVNLVEELLGVVPTAQVISVLANALQGDKDGIMCRKLESVLEDKEPWQVLMRLTQLLVDFLTHEPHLLRPMSKQTDEKARQFLVKLRDSTVGRVNMRRALLKLQEAELQVRQAPVPSLWLKSSLLQLPLFFSPQEEENVAQTMLYSPQNYALPQQRRWPEQPSSSPALHLSETSTPPEIQQTMVSLEETEPFVVNQSEAELVTNPITTFASSNEVPLLEDTISTPVDESSLLSNERSVNGVNTATGSEPPHAIVGEMAAPVTWESTAAVRHEEDLTVPAVTFPEAAVAAESDESYGLEKLKEESMEHITVKSHKSLLASKGKVVSICLPFVTIEFPEGLIPKATSTKPLQSFTAAFTAVLKTAVQLKIIPSKVPRASSPVPKKVTRVPQLKRRVTAVRKTRTEVKPEAAPPAVRQTRAEVRPAFSVPPAARSWRSNTASRKAEDDDYHTRVTDEFAAQAWERAAEIVKSGADELAAMAAKPRSSSRSDALWDKEISDSRKLIAARESRRAARELKQKQAEAEEAREEFVVLSDELEEDPLVAFGGIDRNVRKDKSGSSNTKEVVRSTVGSKMITVKDAMRSFKIGMGV